MQVRLGFAASIYLDPDVLRIDEIFAVGSEDFQRRCRETMLEFKARGKTIVSVSHSAKSVEEICDRVYVLDHDHGLITQSHLAAEAR